MAAARLAKRTGCALVILCAFALVWRHALQGKTTNKMLAATVFEGTEACCHVMGRVIARLAGLVVVSDVQLRHCVALSDVVGDKSPMSLEAIKMCGLPGKAIGVKALTALADAWFYALQDPACCCAT